MLWRTLITCIVFASTQSQPLDNEETDGQSSRRILGSSVVTSVSVVMETGNGKHTYFSDAVGHPLSKPHIASQVASPINLLNPDRYEFYTFNDDGELVKRLMTLEEIQGIIAGGDGEASNYNSELNSENSNSENDVSGVVENVQNVLKEEIEAHKNPPLDPPVMDTPDVSETWNMILPAFFGDSLTNDAVTPDTNNYVGVSQKYNDASTTEYLIVASRTPEDHDLSDEYNLPLEITTAHTPTEQKINPSTGHYSTMNLLNSTLVNTLKPVHVSSTENMLTTTMSPLQTNNMMDIFTFNTEKLNSMTDNEMVTQKLATSTKLDEQNDITEKIFSTTKMDMENNKMNMPLLTERINIQDTTIEAQSSLIQNNEYPKITELVSMITRPTIKTSEKQTTTMRTTSVTFPQSTQITHFEQISQSSSLQPVLNEDENYNITTLEPNFINNNYANLTDNNNENQTTVTNMFENESTTYIENVTKNIISNVDQIIANVSNDIITENEKIMTENYNVTNLIEDVLNLTALPDLKNKTVTLASIIIDPNRMETKTTEKILTVTMKNTDATTSDFKITSKENLDTMQQISTSKSTTVEQTTKKDIIPSSTTKTTESITYTTPISMLKDNSQTLSTPPQIKITENIPTLSTQITVNNTFIPIQMTTPDIQLNKTTSTTIKITSTATTPISTESTTILDKEKLTTNFITTTVQNEMMNETEIFILPTIVSTTPEGQPTEINIENRFAVPVTTKNISSNYSTTEPYQISTTNKKYTTEYTKVPHLTSTPVSTSFKQSTTQKLSTLPTFIKPITHFLSSSKITTNKNENKQTTKPFSNPKIDSSTVTTKIIISSTEGTTKQNISTTNSQILSTTPMPTTTITTLSNISEPYRKTEEMPNKITPIIDSWKLVETVKPPEPVNKTTTIISTTFKPTYKPLDAYQPAKVDLSSQGNFGIPVLDEDMYVFSKMYNELALKFWNALSIKDINSERSAVVSPFGAISMLAMIFLGARGGTSGEMNDVLKLDDVVTFNPHLVFKEVTESVTKRKSPSAIVRELYSDSNKGKVIDFYKERVRYFYDGHVEEVDFKKIHNVIRRRTNALISKQTRGQLPQYLEETTLSLRSPLSALSTNIFQADCSQASIEGRDGEFYFIVLPSIRQRRLVPIPAAVWRTGFIAGYDPELDATAVSLGTMSQTISTIFVMPGQQGHSAPGDVLLRLEARLLNTTYIPETWNQLLKSMLPRPGLEIQLPRFLHKSVINATEALKRMGLKEMFTKNKANLQGLNGMAHDLYFSDMMQVNEFSICGDSQQIHTEIYPSVVEHLANHNEQMRNFKYMDYLEENEYDKYLSVPLPLRPRQARLPDVPKLRFDRPFLYFVRHNPTGLILHMGRFNPRLLT